MQFYSTNDLSLRVSLKEAVIKGLPDDQGLYMPHHIPVMPADFFTQIHQLTFQEIAFRVSKALIGEDVPEKFLREIVEGAVNFDAPVVPVHDQVHALELFHGPTLAFKDFGARFMARLMAYLLRDEATEINILVATSGDTGSAVAQGFLNVPGIKVTILYPKGKVSEIQEKQLTTLGQNISAIEVNGTFDDCQKLVKQAFLDQVLNKKIQLTSANSINISRLIPQSFYYFYACGQFGQPQKNIVFSVPSGNFGNLCGGLIAKRMGLPVNKFIVSTNINDVVPAYLSSGDFIPRASEKTISNAMDVGNPSNFFRIKDLYRGDLRAIRKDITGYTFTDNETKQAMKKVYEQYQYMLDPHGAIGYLGLNAYLDNQKEDLAGVFLATAHPAKFIEVVEEQIEEKIEIPARLKVSMNKEKTATAIDNDYEQLKEFLLK